MSTNTASQNSKNNKLVIGVIAFAFIAAIALLVVIRAGGLSYVFESEDSDLTNASKKTDADSSNGTFIEFGSNDGNDDTPKEATYRVTLNSTWNSENPGYPAGAHLSPMVVTSHFIPGEFFSAGEVSTPGMEIVAETGATSVISEELTELGTIRFAIGNRIDAPGTDTVELTVDRERSLLSLVSMLAPSPDWVVGVRDVSLFNNDTWLESTTLTLNAYDAGTDSGTTFTAEDIDTQPKAPFGEPVDEQFKQAAEAGFGTVTLELISQES